jgi:hypothetical protein
MTCGPPETVRAPEVPRSCKNAPEQPRVELGAEPQFEDGAVGEGSRDDPTCAATCWTAVYIHHRCGHTALGGQHRPASSTTYRGT